MTVTSRYVAIPDGELKITVIRMQGTDRQHVDKTSTITHLRFDIQASSLSGYYRECLLAVSHHLISSDGVIIVKAQEHHSQGPSRGAVLVWLVAMTKELTTEKKARRSTRPIRASKKRELASKAQKPSMKAMRDKVRSSRE